MTEKVINHRLTNLLHTGLLILGMTVLMALLGGSLAGTTGLIWAVISGGLFLLFGQRFSSTWVLRMMGARPLSQSEAPRLFQIVAQLAKRAGLPRLPKIYYIPHQMMNAFAVGTRENAAIGVTDSLLRNLDNRELAGVLAHEISHIRHNDMRVIGFADMISRITRMFSFFGQVLLFLNFPLLLMGRAGISWAAILLLIFAPTLSGAMLLALSRTREFDADIGAVRLTGDPRGLANALYKLEYYQSSSLRRIIFPGYRTPDPSVLRTHPPTQERIERLISLTEGRFPEKLSYPEIYGLPETVPESNRRPRWPLVGLSR